MSTTEGGRILAKSKMSSSLSNSMMSQSVFITAMLRTKLDNYTVKQADGKEIVNIQRKRSFYEQTLTAPADKTTEKTFTMSDPVTGQKIVLTSYEQLQRLSEILSAGMAWYSSH